MNTFWHAAPEIWHLKFHCGQRCSVSLSWISNNLAKPQWHSCQLTSRELCKAQPSLTVNMARMSPQKEPAGHHSPIERKNKYIAKGWGSVHKAIGNYAQLSESNLPWQTCHPLTAPPASCDKSESWKGVDRCLIEETQIDHIAQLEIWNNENACQIPHVKQWQMTSGKAGKTWWADLSSCLLNVNLAGKSVSNNRLNASHIWNLTNEVWQCKTKSHLQWKNTEKIMTALWFLLRDPKICDSQPRSTISQHLWSVTG